MSNSGAIKKEPGAANMLRVKTNGNSVTFYINDTKVRELRGQAPKTSWRFGLSGDNFDKQKDARVVFKTVKVDELAGAQQLRRVAREIGEDGVGARALERDQALQHDTVLVEPAALEAAISIEYSPETW